MVKLDATHLTMFGLAEDERKDFLNTVQGFIDELGYDIKAENLTFDAETSEKNFSLTKLTVGYGGYIVADANSTNYGMNGYYKYTDEQYKEFQWQVEQAINRSGIFSDKGYTQKMRQTLEQRRGF